MMRCGIVGLGTRSVVRHGQEYKAALVGVEVVEVDPRKTSQTCHKCGHAERGNRPRQAIFGCKRCGYRGHADLNASRVIAAGGACSIGAGDVTSPRPEGRSGEAMVAH